MKASQISMGNGWVAEVVFSRDDEIATGKGWYASLYSLTAESADRVTKLCRSEGEAIRQARKLIPR